MLLTTSVILRKFCSFILDKLYSIMFLFLNFTKSLLSFEENLVLFPAANSIK